mmetsp:Transcript_139961/g.260973  ORF Transcript_139961/g.260973 Transcript_139961/m.260973 type:complete len:204 (+) Transcript_139961:372-983(+)
MISCTTSPPRPMTLPASASLTWITILVPGLPDVLDLASSFSILPSCILAKGTSSKISLMAKSCASASPNTSNSPVFLSTSILAFDSDSITLTTSPLRPSTRPTSSGRTSTTTGSPSASLVPLSAFRVFLRTLPSSPSSRQKRTISSTRFKAASRSGAVPVISTKRSFWEVMSLSGWTFSFATDFDSILRIVSPPLPMTLAQSL